MPTLTGERPRKWLPPPRARKHPGPALLPEVARDVQADPEKKIAATPYFVADVLPRAEVLQGHAQAISHRSGPDRVEADSVKGRTLIRSALG